MIRLPAEWEPHEATAMCWPQRADPWGDRFAEAEHAYAEVANTIARFESVVMIAAPRASERAAALCGTGVEVVELPIDDSWFRDSGPIYVFDNDDRLALDFEFNSWGEKLLPYDDDAAVARRFADLRGDDVRSVPMVLEGGSINGDGHGTIVTTEQCLLHPNRNPTMRHEEIEMRLISALGLDQVMWLPHGLALDFDTDGHVDNIAAFAPGRQLVVQGCDDTSEPDHDRLADNRRIAEQACEVVTVPILPFTEVAGARVAVPYLNYYVGNGFVLVPTCGKDADADMVALIGEQYPDREAIALDVGAILAHGGGGIHCITNQIPEGNSGLTAQPPQR